MTKPHIIALLSGILSAGLFIVALQSPLVVIGIYLPLLPLMLIGLRFGLRAAVFSVSMAILSLLFTGNLGLLIFFILFLAVPACIFIRQALLWREKYGEREWYPVGRILTYLTFYTCIMFLLVALHYASQGGIEPMIANEMSKNFAHMPPDMVLELKDIAKNWAFLAFASTAWSWVLMTYGMAALAQVILTRHATPIRPSLRLLRFETTPWLLFFFVAVAGLSLSSNMNAVFMGKSLLIILLFPYFLSGICLLHSESLKWPARSWMLAAVYILMISLFWPLLLLAAIGLIEQLLALNKRMNTDTQSGA